MYLRRRGCRFVGRRRLVVSDRASHTFLRLLPAVLLLPVISLGCPRTRSDLPPARIVIASYPESGAEVSVGGAVRGETPLVVQGLPAQSTLIVLKREGFRRATRMVDIPETGDLRVVIELEPLVGYVTFESKPSGAKIFLEDGSCIGETPAIRRSIVIGKHTYTLRKDNFKDLSGELDIQEEYVYRIAHELSPIEAVLKIFSRPTGSRIWINDEERPETTPAKLYLAPGEYSVSVHNKGYVMAVQSVMLGPNQEKTLEIELKQGDAPPGMILIPAGKFIMGVNGASPDERPQREVFVDAFYIDQNEVTNAEYKAVFPEHRFPKGQEQFPVTSISFDLATVYAQRVGKRLPTEAEWEKAARGTDAREYPWGMDFHEEWCHSSNAKMDSPIRVGQFRMGASPYGCLDMAGNVYEWTSDWYQAYPGNTDVVKDYGQVFRVLRGGSFRTDRFRLRCARRHYDRVDAACPDYGIRCAKDVGSREGMPQK